MIIPNSVTGSRVRGDHRNQHDHAVRCQQSSHPTDPSDIGVTILAAEAQAGRQMWPNFIAVQYLYPLARGIQLVSQGMSDG
jgi:hypothetical protein